MSNLEICQAAIGKGKMPPFENWCKLNEAGRQYLLLAALLKEKARKAKNEPA